MLHTIYRRLTASEYLIYSLLIGLVGLVLVFLVPPYQSPDEQTHLYRAYQLSDGHIISQRLPYGAGDILPASLSDSFNDYAYLMFNPEAKLKPDILRSSLDQPLLTHRETPTRFENTAIYPPVAYAPQVIGIWVGKIFSASPVILLYLARLANLAVWVGLLWFAMRRNKRFALPIFAFGLLPIVAFQSASASADVLTTGVVLAFVMEVLHACLQPGLLGRKDGLILASLVLLLALVKFPYVILAGLLLMIPARRFANTKIELQYKAGLLGMAGVVAGLWLIVAQKTFVNLRAGVDSAAQAHFIISQPITYAKTLFQTYVSLPSDTLYLQMVGQLGWLDTKLPLWSILLGTTSVLLAVISVTLPASVRPLGPRQRVWAVVVLGVTVVAISTSLYLTWSAPKAVVVDGLQGRYFMPLFAVVLCVAGGALGLQKAQYRRARRVVLLLSGSVLASTLITLLLRYYSV